MQPEKGRRVLSPESGSSPEVAIESRVEAGETF